METEFKLKLESEAQVEKLLNDELFRSIALSDVPTLRRMRTIYYDTEQLDLTHQNAAFRIRDENDDRVMTLKIGRMSEFGLHQRQEWVLYLTPEIEEKLGRERFNAEIFLNEADGGGDADDRLREILDLIAEKELVEVGTANFEREAYDAGFGDSLLEIVIDRGTIECKAQTSELFEMEIELKEGNVQDLIDLVDHLKEYFQLRPETRSKYSRCLELIKRHA